MPLLVLTPEFEQELDESERDDPQSWDAAAVLLEDFMDREDFPSVVPSKHYGGYPGFEVKWFQAAKEQGYRILIVKFLNAVHRLSRYRILIGHYPDRDTYYALAYRTRDEAYDQSPQALGELFDRYRQCGIP